jgi:hypothetical protein
MKFLSHMRPNWNISLFHYRNQGADYGRILVGLQVPASDHAAFQTTSSTTLGYPYVEETANPVYRRLFLRKSWATAAESIVATGTPATGGGASPSLGDASRSPQNTTLAAASAHTPRVVAAAGQRGDA